MKDDRKHSSDMQELSSGISAGRSAREIQAKLRAELYKTAALVLVSLFAIVLGSVAWFVSNSKVDSGGIKVSHQYDTITLATKGKRQQKEEELLKLDTGKEIKYHNETYYYTDQGEIALCLSDSSVAVSPGMSGKISFYIIPDRTGEQTVTLHLGLAGYEEREENGSPTARKINDPVLNSLLSGHILLFKTYEEGRYSNWLQSSVSTEGLDYQITVTNSEAKEGEPWPVTFYWVWPLRYENLAEDFVVGGQNLFSGFITDQASHLSQIEGTSFYYSQIFLTNDIDPQKNESLESEKSRSDAYNQADEYIGTKADYLYVTVQTDLVN